MSNEPTREELLEKSDELRQMAFFLYGLGDFKKAAERARESMALTAQAAQLGKPTP